MATPTFDDKVFENNDQKFEDDRRLLVQFFMTPVEDKNASEKEGRPIFREVPNIRIITPGSRDVMVTRATPAYQNRFPRQWERFQKQMDQNIEGTPLEQVPWLTVGIIAELKAINCLTLEGLANMSDQAIGKMMGMQQFRTRARNYLEAAKSAAPFTAMQAQIEARDTEISVLKEQMAQLLAAAAKKE